MGLYPYPPNESYSVLSIIVVNIAMAISIFKANVRWILHTVKIHLSSFESESMEYPPNTIMDEFQKQVPPIRFGSVFNCKNFKQECLVCLIRFKRNSVINHLHCGHVFHKVCLEKWLDYSNITCPLCRTSLMPQKQEKEPQEESPELYDCY
ncbi:hypothetical protein AQUCO_09300011v1 [Aquilegia coerulea]|uniref:RING-type domain-containing protein n=1 Tax=Aquilegia coerulea TaxID=218851 RepID=A0A2G5C6H8_AQUCA|nr:hypothetical protein AQUCO_09300011v1 [Aquilegia coerulea]